MAKPIRSGSSEKRTVSGKSPGRVESRKARPLAYDIPYLAWAAATNYRYLGVPPKARLSKLRIPLLLELARPASGFEAAVAHGGLDKIIEVPPLFAAPSAGLDQVTFCTASVTPAFFTKATARRLASEWIKRIEFGLPGLQLPQIPAPGPAAPAQPPVKVVTAVMDDALPFAHERFLDANGTTRVEYVWRQSAPGLVISRAQIEAAMAGNTHAGIVDEDAVYRSLGFEDPAASGHKALWRRRAHGAHVMDLACGRDASGGANTAIIGVQFPADAIRDTSGAWLTPHVYLGLRFILEAADKLANAQGSGPLPVVVNVSYGKFADSHDGLSVLEAAMDQLIEERRAKAPFSVVLPSGNSFLARCHAQVSLAPDKSRTLHWRVQPDDRTPSFLEIWPGPVANDGTAPALEVSVTAPRFGTVLTATRGKPPAEWKPSGQLLASAEYRTPGQPGAHRDMVLVTLAPTATLDATEQVAPSGTWKLTVKNCDTGNAVDIQAWVQRDDTPYGWPITGRQSRFDDSSYERFHPAGTYDRATAAGIELATDSPTSYVKRAGSLNAIATGKHPVVVAAFRKSDGTPAPYSSGGPLPPGTRAAPTPDVAAVGDDSPVGDGVLAAGARSGSTVAMRGTSIAAPQITRFLANRMHNGQSSDRSAFQGAVPAPGPGMPAAPPERIGAGRMDAQPPRRVRRR